MRAAWTQKQLRDCLELVIDHRGKTPKKLGAEWVSHGIPVISANNVYGGKLVAAESIRHVSHDVYKRWMKTDVRRGDCLLVSEGATLGECLFWDFDRSVVLGQRIFGLRADPRVLYPRYLYAYMTSRAFQSEIHGRATGTSVAGLRQTELLKLSIKLPPIWEQRRIGDLVYCLNAKIGLNQRMNETLEAIAKELFKAWFIEATKNGLPEGWSESTVRDEVDLVKGVSYRSAELRDSNTALVTLKSFKRGGGYRPEGLKPYAGEFENAQIVRPGELVIAVTDVTQAAEVIGKPALVTPNEQFKTLVASLDLMIVRPKSDILSPHFFYLLFRTADFQSHVYGHTNGTTVLHLGKQGIPSYRFAKPPESIGRKFTALMVPIYKRIATNESESRTLASLRDALLPKLLSGAIRVGT